MNVFLLPNVCALLVFLGAFRPLARRAGPHSNDWFLGWAFVFLNVALLTFQGAQSEFVIIRVGTLWAIELGGVLFLRAAAEAPKTRLSYLISAEMAAPIMLQSALVAFHANSELLHCAATLLMLVPAAHFALLPEHRTPVRKRIATALAVAAVCLAPIAYLDAAFALSLVHALLFLATARLYWQYEGRASSGVLTAIIGLVLWGLAFPAEALLLHFGGWSNTALLLLQTPDYLVAYGMILTLIEQHVRRTESLALHDALTGLPNRRLFNDRLEQALALAPHTGTMLACIVIDVDNFKHTNDTLGHLVGDELLQAVTTRLNWQICPGDTLARTGGDEFSAVLTRLQSLEHLRFVVGAMMSATCVPVAVGDHSINVGLSIGIALYPSGGTTVDDLRRNADDAMYEAKRNGGNQFAYVGGPPDEAAHLLGSMRATYAKQLTA